MAMLHTIYFSGKGTTRACAEYIGQLLDREIQTYDWLRQPCDKEQEMMEDDVLLFSMPVYGCFIPYICAGMARHLKGNHTPAILAAVYGNRHYDYALQQMKDILTAQGFVVIAAGAFLAQHSIFPSVASGRPDERDKAVMTEFAAACRELLQGWKERRFEEIRLPGSQAYDAASFQGVPFHPDADKTCTGCGACVSVCPMRAIDAASPAKTDPAKCISCGACIAACPAGARGYHGAAYKAAGLIFAKKCSAYRVAELYYVKELQV